MADADKREQVGSTGRENTQPDDGERSHARTEKALETERDFLAAVLESADAFILVLDSVGRIQQVNRAVKLATGYADDDLRGREFISALPIHEAATALGDGLRRLREGSGAYSFESHWVTQTGERLLVAGSLTPMRDGAGELAHVVITASDITGRRALEDELRALSLRDDMTGLCNRRGFALLAEQRFKECQRSGSPLTLIYGDVDHLKAINDGFGHGAGDIALGLCARALEATFRESDVVARIGGDEFVVLAEADARDLRTVNMQLKQGLDRLTAESGLRFSVSLTIGSAHSTQSHPLSLNDMLRKADDFMYEHKLRGPYQLE